MIIIIVGYIIVFAVTNIILKYLYNIKKNLQFNEEGLNKLLTRGFMEMVVFRINRRFKKEIEKVNLLSEDITNSKTKMVMIHEAFFTIFAVLIGFVKVIIIALCFYNFGLSVGKIVALLTLVDKAYNPIAILDVIYVQYKLNQVSFNRYKELLELPDDNQLLVGSEPIIESGEIKFESVDFNYEEKNLLKNFYHHIMSGKSTAFVGESGAGKSTVVKLLVGLIKPTNGVITIDGNYLNEMNSDN